MKIGIIGAGGFVGRRLCQELAAHGNEVIRYSSDNHLGISKETGLLPQDFTFPCGLQAVIYLSQSPRYRLVPAESPHLISVNCLAAVQAAEAARKRGIERFIYTSTGNVYAPSFRPLTETSPVRRDNWYSLSKVMAEDALSLFRRDINVTVVRIFGVYGPGQVGKLVPNIAESIQHKREVFVDRNPNDLNDHDGLRISLIYIDDLVEALINLLAVSACDTINLSGPESTSIRNITDTISQLLKIQTLITTRSAFREGELIADATRYMELFPGTRFVSLREGLQNFTESIRP